MSTTYKAHTPDQKHTKLLVQGLTQGGCHVSCLSRELSANQLVSHTKASLVILSHGLSPDRAFQSILPNLSPRGTWPLPVAGMQGSCIPTITSVSRKVHGTWMNACWMDAWVFCRPERQFQKTRFQTDYFKTMTPTWIYMLWWVSLKWGCYFLNFVVEKPCLVMETSHFIHFSDA